MNITKQLKCDSPTIQTARLNIFVFGIRVSDICHAPRRLYVGYLRDEDYPGHIVMATVMEAVNMDADTMPPYLDWIETSNHHRRQGFARELFAAIETDMGREVACDGATIEGEAFVKAVSR